MYRIAIFLMLIFADTAICFAQIKPRVRVMREVADQSMIIDDRGSELEVLPTVRIAQKVSASGKEIGRSAIQAEPSASISPKQPGVVFNHAMQVYGYITGEISFKMKDGLQPPNRLDPSSYPGLAKLTNPDIYIVVAQSPSEFVELVKRLQGREDIEWVEPIVTYGDQQPIIGTEDGGQREAQPSPHIEDQLRKSPQL